MRLPVSLIAASIVLSQTASAQTQPTFSPAEVRAHVTFLADDLLEGRNAGTRGYDIAARYVATRFEALGLRPGGPNGSWYQDVPFVEFSLDAKKPASVTIGTRNFPNSGSALIGPSAVHDGLQTLSGDAVFVGYGMEKEFEGLDVRGKFVVALIGSPNLPPEQIAALGSGDKAANAHKNGAIGVIHVATPSSGFPWDQARTYFARPRLNWVAPSGDVGAEKPGVSIAFYVDAEAAKSLFDGSAMSADQLFEAIKKPALVKGFALKQPVRTERTTVQRKFTSPNVVALLPGSDPKLKDEVVVLTAHLDHDGVDPSLTGDQIYNGAMDNAAGIATMLEAARAFKQGKKAPKRTILFTALTAEEDGLLGSEYLAKYPLPGASNVIANVNLDMPVLLYDFKDVVAFGAEHSTLGPIVSAATKKMGVAVSPDPMPEEQLFMRSDHYSFVKEGVPSVFLVTGFANGGEQAFKNFLSTHYHKVSDQIDLPFNWDAAAKFAKINYMIANEIANGKQAPRWYEGNMFGDRFAADQPKAPAPKNNPLAATPAKE